MRSRTRYDLGDDWINTECTRMPTFSQLPSGKWRVQVRRAGIYRAATFASKREARDWATGIEAQANHIAASGYTPIPKGATVADLIDRYVETTGRVKVGDRIKHMGKTKALTMNMLKREIGKVKLASLNAIVLSDFIDRRKEAGAGGVTIGADLSYLSAVLKWGRGKRRLDLPERLALDARAMLTADGMETRSAERSREPTDDELARLYAHWEAKQRQKIPMELLCKFALATGMRQGEICRLDVEDIDREKQTIIIRDRKHPKAKLGNDQEVPLLEVAWALVEPLIENRTDGRLFPYLEASVSTAFTRACQDLVPPIEDLHFHDLRHRATAEFFRMGLDIPKVAILTGHKSWAMLRRYTKITAQDVRDGIKKPASPAPD